MVAFKFLGIIVAFQIFIGRDAFAQSFYPARYGKRDENVDFQVDSLMEGKRLGRTNEQNSITDRKIRFFISGGRYGKRGCSSEKCSKGGRDFVSSGFETDRETNDRINIPIRKNQFMMGSRFGKRFDALASQEPGSTKNPWCRFVPQRDVFKCSGKSEARFEVTDDSLDPNFINGTPM